nr:MAG TPA: hypothetical protein [Caudoviricetes sp.]
MKSRYQWYQVGFFLGIATKNLVPSFGTGWYLVPKNPLLHVWACKN